MDELQISGKRYISSRRIAKDNGYHTDYIGQLIRGGKIKGQKVGRTWYVDEASFTAYLSDSSAPPEAAPEAPVEIAEQAALKDESVFLVPRSSEIAQSAPKVAEIKKEEPRTSPIQETIEEPTENTPIAVRIEREPEKILAAAAAPIAVRLASPALSRGLRYVADDGPLMPEIPQKRITSLMPAAATQEEAEILEDPRPRTRSSSKTRLLSMAVAGTIAFVAAGLVGSSMFQTLHVGQDGTASAGYSLHW